MQPLRQSTGATATAAAYILRWRTDTKTRFGSIKALNEVKRNGKGNCSVEGILGFGNGGTERSFSNKKFKKV